jgi:hypothetical protein
MKLRNSPKSQSKPDRQREIIRVLQYLDSSMKVEMEMGIPTLLYPNENNDDFGFMP